MKMRTITGLTTVVMVLLAGLLTAPAAVAADDQPQNTEDVLHLTDGRVLHGTILEETDTSVKFEYVDSDTGIRGVQTISKSRIAGIDRDVPIKRESENKEQDAGPRPTSSAEQSPDKDGVELRRFGVNRASASDERVPSFYIVPMKGQMGTDINSQTYEDVIEDIKAVDPDVIVFEMNCEDKLREGFEDKRFDQGIWWDLGYLDDYRKMVNMFRHELRGYRQVLWAENAYGISAACALAWDEFYMKPEAKLGRLNILQAGYAGFSDENVKGKMREAWLAMIKSFLEYGNYPLVLADAMIRPEVRLSGSFKGRTIEWRKDTEGEYIVDASPVGTLEMTAKTAEDLTVTDGTAETLDDLALLMGYREYRVIGGRGEQMVEKYKENWRSALDRCKQWLIDAAQYEQWAGGDDTLRYLGRAKNTYEDILKYMERYQAVEIRLLMERGVRKFDLITKIELLKEQIRALRNRGRGNGGGGGGGMGGGMGGG